MLLLANLKVYPASVLEECFNFDSVRTLLLHSSSTMVAPFSGHTGRKLVLLMCYVS